MDVWMASTAANERLWLSHHGCDQPERCFRVGRQAVCRRCAVLYPIAVLSAALVLLMEPPVGVLTAMMWMLPLPMVLDWVVEHLGRVSYSRSRQLLTTAVAAPGLGAMFALNALEPLSLAALTPALFWSFVCMLSTGIAWYRNAPQEDAGWEVRHRDEEAERVERLRAMLGLSDHQGNGCG